METDYSKHTYFRWKIKWRLEHLGALGTMGEAALINSTELHGLRILFKSEVNLTVELPRKNYSELN